SLLMAPLLGRTALVFLFLTTPYVRQNGLGSRIAQQLPRRACLFAILFTLAFFPLFVGINAAWFLIGAGSLFFVLRAFMLLRIGGTTGDTAGALVEITETFTLITAVLLG
ncbi:MAG: adenosylcobinamide-GDP ribazoletransferase, partial [Methylococcales bacterium]